MAKLNNKAAIIPAASMVTHHADCEYPFRQNSDFWYLTGFDEADAVAMFLPYRPKGEQYILFVQPSDLKTEVWNGSCCGIDDAVNQFGADIAYSLAEFPSLIGNFLLGAEGIAFRVGKHLKIEPLVLQSWAEQLDQFQRSGCEPLSMIPPCPLIHEMRLYKDSTELELLRKAAKISAEAHELAREVTSPGMSERQLQGVVEQYFLEKGARGPAYNSIVAGGDNACVLHYTKNNSTLRDGELVLIDAGCSLFDYYNGDITRTFPINGKFTSEQKALYEIVLTAQQTAIDSIVPGQNAEGIHMAAVKVLVEGLVDLGILIGNVDSLIEQGAYRHLYMHRTGHWLGLDVHDVGAYRLGEYHVHLEKGMVLTVEPGLYISDRLDIPEGQPEIHSRWKGIGIRIEDDVFIGQNEIEVLTSGALKSIHSMEK